MTDQMQQVVTYLSLNALRIRSTSSSRWKADASRESSCSISVSLVEVGVFELEGVDVPVDMSSSSSWALRFEVWFRSSPQKSHVPATLKSKAECLARH